MNKITLVLGLVLIAISAGTVYVQDKPVKQENKINQEEKCKFTMLVNSNERDYYPQDKPGHLKLFEKCMGVPIDQLEEEWRKYILELK
jgi:hypothetical protein